MWAIAMCNPRRSKVFFDLYLLKKTFFDAVNLFYFYFLMHHFYFVCINGQGAYSMIELQSCYF